jgi:hypothetical protein
MSRERWNYLSYLLRLWRDGGETPTTWRASLESSLTAERQSFASLDDLCAFLRQQTGATNEAKDDEGTTKEQRETYRRPPAPRV